MYVVGMQNRNVIGETSHAKKPRESVIFNDREKDTRSERKDPISYKDILRTNVQRKYTSEK